MILTLYTGGYSKRGGSVSFKQNSHIFVKLLSNISIVECILTSGNYYLCLLLKQAGEDH